MATEADTRTNEGRDARVYHSLYSPSLRKVGCVLLNVAYGLDRYPVNSIVDADDWFVSPVDDALILSGTEADWRRFANNPKERPGPEFFARAAIAKATGSK